MLLNYCVPDHFNGFKGGLSHILYTLLGIDSLIYGPVLFLSKERGDGNDM